MSRQNCFVKISGDMLNDDTIQLIETLSKEYFVVVCVGGGTQINNAFREAGHPVEKFGPLGRETKTLEQKQLARDVLEDNQAQIQDRLADRGVYASVVIPVIEVGTVLCHVNGDQYVLAAYHGFDKLCVVTEKSKVNEKKKFFSNFEKIKVVGF